MQLAQYFMCIATRHALAMEVHNNEIKERLTKKKRKVSNLTYNDEGVLLNSVISSVRNKPDCLKMLTDTALISFAYIIKAKIGNDPYVLGHEIIDKLACDPERIIEYLNGFTELNDSGWIRIFERPGSSFIDQPPFCWLQSSIELGNTFHKEMGGGKQKTYRAFTSNEAYLDAVFAYLHSIIQDESDIYRVNNPEVDLYTVELDGWYRRIAQRTEISDCTIPAIEAQKKYDLSVHQQLTLVGLMGSRDGDVRYDFSNPSDVTQLFARGRMSRKQMKEHLFGAKGSLMRNKLIEGTRGTFGEAIQLTQRGITALLGKKRGKSTINELKDRIKKNTLFDFEEPKLKKESLYLPDLVMEAIRALIFSESHKGQQLRKSWNSALPSAWGSPTGSTVLLYGPPGTGKTLTAQYLASEMKRPLIKIDAAKVLSCWVGESEQNVRRIFDDYLMLQKELGNSPVLLLNEADQLLGSRDAGKSAVDRMNNNMQNLFLEGLERFSGILVATTNRRDLLDEAFSRRFTYKLELPPPARNHRIALWQSHLPMNRLADDIDISKLADIGLTGGEIRLVVERAVRMQAYRGLSSIDSLTLMNIAKEELASRMKRNGGIGKIGFGTDSSC